ncbi:hypothetical protein RO3G_04997 [Lichtheimia corymbifera JMRC:FSU:9682]|uniref:RlpA-like protein double-psi beta-barrel domain-containing protein n=1 Tax=Lichtheimia corymbifera JMRC:FSU:9682 TaxID=1263082 RepID=A0A068RJH9_9FUNG|nr:hypothetical protein RO3G_04997 [Lichtheimia corymbifera JMRC:FSU:9682]
MFRFVTILALVIVASLLTAAAPAGKISNTPAAHNTKRSSYSGKGTFFTPSINGGSTGSCGEYEADDEYVVALNAKQYGSLTSKSGWCFKKIRIHHDGKQVEATIKDACPECQYGDLDLGPKVFKELDTLVKGIIDITWEEI